MADQDGITVEAHEIEGLAEHLEVRLGCAGEGFEHARDRRAYLGYLHELLNIQDVLNGAGHGGVVIPRSETVETLIRTGADYAPERFADALQGRCDDQTAAMRQSKGLMSLGARTGLYEGVVV